MMLLWMMQSNQVQVQTRITDACTSHRPWSNLCIKPSWEINPVQHEATGYKLTCIWSCWSAVMSRTIIENHLNLLFVKRKSNLFPLSLIAMQCLCVPKAAVFEITDVFLKNIWLCESYCTVVFIALAQLSSHMTDFITELFLPLWGWNTVSS